MYIIEKDISFDAGHRLMLYNGLCGNIHGHRYSLVIGIEGNELQENDILVDFNEISKYVKNYINNFVDHGMILNNKDVFWIEALQSQNQRLYMVNGNPTAENLSKHFYKIFKEQFTNISYIKIYETPTGRAIYKE